MDYKDVSLTTVRALRERTVPYRPSYRKMLGNANAAILLSQINYWWDNNGEKRFYKFSAPCEHSLYRENDSWQEELGFSKDELNTALKHVATKISPKEINEYRKIYVDDGSGNLVLAPANRIVIYWKTQDNVTWYELNDELLALHLINMHKCSKSEVEFGIPEFGKVEFANSAKSNSNLYIDEQYIDEQEKKKEKDNTPIFENSAVSNSNTTQPSRRVAIDGFILESKPSTVEDTFSPSGKEKAVTERSPLTSLIERVTKTKLTKAQKTQLSQEIVISYTASKKGVKVQTPEVYPSPETLFESNTLFAGFVQNTLDEYLLWAKTNVPESKRRGYVLNGGILKRLRGYGEDHGWLKYQERYTIPEVVETGEDLLEHQERLNREMEEAVDKFRAMQDGKNII